MNKLHTLAIATTLSIFSLGAQAADNFAGLTWGESTVNIDRSSTVKQNMPGANRFDDTIKNSGTWGIRAGQNLRFGGGLLVLLTLLWLGLTWGFCSLKHLSARRSSA